MDWPYELDVNSISEDVDQNSFLQKWDKYIDDHKREYHSCNFVGKRSLDRRCSQRRSLEEWYGNFDLALRSANSSYLVDRQTESVDHPTIFPRGSDELDKRFLGFLFDILAAFGARLATGIVARATSAVTVVTRYAQTADRLFQIAKGSTGRGGAQGMKNARSNTKSNQDQWLKCLKEGLAM